MPISAALRICAGKGHGSGPGCGYGILPILADGSERNVIGIEMNAGKSTRTKIPNVQFMNDDITKLKSPLRCGDPAGCAASFQSFDEQEKFLRYCVGFKRYGRACQEINDTPKWKFISPQ